LWKHCKEEQCLKFERERIFEDFSLVLPRLILLVTFAIFSWSHVADSTLYFADEQQVVETGNLLWTTRKTEDGKFWDIPYKIDPTFGSEEKQKHEKFFDTLSTVLKQYHDRTCLRFRRISFEDDTTYPHMIFQDKNGKCQSKVGRCQFNEGKCFRQINLNKTCRKRTMATTHEIMHALGWNHALNRPDRDNFVRIRWEHVKAIHNGCFKDWKVRDKHLKLTIDEVTVDKCRASCLDENYLIFGVQAPNKCFCATKWNFMSGVADASFCQACQDDETLSCGWDDGYYSVYNLYQNFPTVESDNGVGFPMDPFSVMMAGFMAASRYENHEDNYENFPPITYNDGSEIVRPEKRYELSDGDINMINKVYGCRPEPKE